MERTTDAAAERFHGCEIFTQGVRLRGKQRESGSQGGCGANSEDDFSVAWSLSCRRRDFLPGVVPKEQHVQGVEPTPRGQDAAECRVERGEHGPDQQKIHDPAEDQKIAGPEAAVQNFYGGDEFSDGQGENQYGACEQKWKPFAVKFACRAIFQIAQIELECPDGGGNSGEHYDFHNAVDAAEGGNKFQREIRQGNAFTHFRQDVTTGEQRFHIPGINCPICRESADALLFGGEEQSQLALVPVAPDQECRPERCRGEDCNREPQI